MMNTTVHKKDKNLILIGSCLSGFIVAVLGTMVNVALPTIGLEFQIGTHNQAWVSVAYFVGTVALLLPVAKLSDKYGKKLIFIIGIFSTVIISLIAFFSSSFIMLVVCRLALGLASACTLTTGVAMIALAYPPKERGLSLGINTAVIYIGSSVGPAIGGTMTDVFGWRSMFLLVIPLAVISFLAIFICKAEFGNTDLRFDHRGTIIYIAGISIFTYGIITLPNIVSVVLTFIGISMIVLFYHVQTRTEQPLMKTSLFKDKTFKLTNFTTVLSYMSMYSIAFFLSLYLQDVGGMTASEAGLLILIQPVIQAILTPIAGRLSDILRPRNMITSGLILTGVGVGGMLFLTNEVNLGLITSILGFVGVGCALFATPNTNLMMANVKREDYAESSGMLSTMRQTGMLLSTGIAMCCISTFMGSNTIIEPSTYGHFMNAVHLAYGISMILIIMAIILAWRNDGRILAEESA